MASTSPFPLRLLAVVFLFSTMSMLCLNHTIKSNGISLQRFDDDNFELVDLDGGEEDRQRRIDAAMNYRKRRTEDFYSWFEGNTTNRLLPNSDANGTILDFAIAGFAKCGTTSMEANLGYIAPLPIGDVCTPVHQTVYYSHINWPKQYGDTKLLRGTKCPRTIGWLNDYSTYLPKTIIIVGIRHPVRFFESFWNLLSDTHRGRDHDPYDFIDHCGEDDQTCNYECPAGQMVCLHKTRFHLPLARMGKTVLGDGERQLLAPGDKDGGNKLTDHNITNPVFLYELNQLNEDYLWEDLARMLDVEKLQHDIHEGSHKDRQPGKQRIDICDAYYDNFRSMIMPNAYNMSKWLCDFFVPVAKDKNRKDVVIPDPDKFCSLVKDYAEDPCKRLVRLDNGTYVRHVSL